MRSWMIAFSLGIFISGFIPSLPSLSLQYLFLIIPLLSIRFLYLRLAGAFCIGIFWFLCWAQAGLDKSFPAHLEGEDLWIEGRIVSLPQRAGLSTRFEFLIDETDQKVLLNLYENLEVKAGQHWHIKVRLKRPHGFQNPGGFDYEAWLLQNNISATGYIRSDPANQLLSEDTSLFSFQKIRDELRQKFENLSEENQLSNPGLIKALSIGDRYNITDEEWALFTATGTNHLIVISGLHVGLVALLVYRLGLFIFSLSSTLLLRIPAQRFAGVTAILAAFVYAGLAGFSLPAQRAFIMVAIFMLGQCLSRHTSVINTYCLTLALVLLLDPLAPQSSGFWLSFGAVGVLILFALKGASNEESKPKEPKQKEPKQKEPKQKVQMPGSDISGKAKLIQKALLVIQTQAYLFIGLLPLMLLFFHQISLLAPVVNIIAIPFVSLLVVPCCLLGLISLWCLPALAGVLFTLADFLLSIFKQSLEYILSFSLSTNTLLKLPSLHWFSMLVLLTGIAILLFLPNDSLRNKVLKVLSLFCFIPLLSPSQAELEKGAFNVDILDVGQGLAILITTRNHHLIYDTGPAYSARFNAGSGILLPFIQARNIKTIDTIVISHGDNDHSGGLPALLLNYPKAKYLSSDMTLFATELSEGVDAALCKKGQHWYWDDIHFEILHPENDLYAGNNSSCVLKISSGDYSVLLSGDIERRAERTLLRDEYDSLKANILIAPHHGSLTSSTQRFIEAVAPAYVVFASGYLNRFNHPHPDVVARYRKAEVALLNTSETGALSFKISAQEGVSEPVVYRESRIRYWSVRDTFKDD